MATQFKMFRMRDEEARVASLVSAMRRFELQPAYQRQSDVWSEEKRALFVDSLINGYDVPKLYFHRLTPNTPADPVYAIVDGKQRLEALRAFMSDGFGLSDDFGDVERDRSGAAAGKRYSELTGEFPFLAARLAERTLDIVVIETADEEVIEELFSRLNEAVPLNAPEKRNAIGGALPPIIRRLVSDHPFFRDRLSVENTRYKQYDLVTKFLFLTSKGDFAAVKKRDLDDFVRSYKGDVASVHPLKPASELEQEATVVLDEMASVFIQQDDLLSSVGLVTVYFMAFLLARSDGDLRRLLVRDKLKAFDALRRQNRQVLRAQQQRIASGMAVEQSGTIRQDLAIFDRLMQSPNDSQALEYRFRILRSFLEDRVYVEELPTELTRKLGDVTG